MIKFSSNRIRETPFVDTGGDNGPIRYFYGCAEFIPVGKRPLDSDDERRLIRPASDGQNIAAQVDHCTFNTALRQIFLDSIGNISLCDGSEINAGFRIREGYAELPVRIFFKAYLLPSDMGERFFDFIGRRNGGFGRSKVPQLGDRQNRNIKCAVSQAAIIKTEAD